MKYLGIDYGSKRIGLAVGESETKLARPLTTLVTTDDYWAELSEITQQEQVDELVVGLPRTLSGNESPQTKEARFFAVELASLKLPIHLQDEAGTSEIARERLGKKLTDKGQIDAEAASIILQDFLDQL
jgi:putative holliday junction resolvase